MDLILHLSYDHNTLEEGHPNRPPMTPSLKPSTTSWRDIMLILQNLYSNIWPRSITYHEIFPCPISISWPISSRPSKLLKAEDCPDTHIPTTNENTLRGHKFKPFHIVIGNIRRRSMQMKLKPLSLNLILKSFPLPCQINKNRTLRRLRGLTSLSACQDKIKKTILDLKGIHEDLT